MFTITYQRKKYENFTSIQERDPTYWLVTLHFVTETILVQFLEYENRGKFGMTGVRRPTSMEHQYINRRRFIYYFKLMMVLPEERLTLKVLMAELSFGMLPESHKWYKIKLFKFKLVCKCVVIARKWLIAIKILLPVIIRYAPDWACKYLNTWT